MKSNHELFLINLRNFYYLHEINSIAIPQFLITKRKSLYVDFMRLKEKIMKLQRIMTVKLLDCLPQTISVRIGLKLLGCNRNENKCFDVAQTNIKSANKI